MLSIFKTNKIILSILLIPYAFILRSYAFFGDVPTDFDNGGILADLIYETIGLDDTWLVSIAFVIILVQAFFIILFTNSHKLSGDRTLYAGVFYVLFSSISVAFLGLSPALMGNTFLLLALSNFFDIYKNKEPAGRHFNAGFWLGIAALFYGSLFLFFFFGILAINLMRAFNIKEMLQMISGYLVPFILLFTYYYAIGDVNASYWAYLDGSFGIINIRETPNLDYITLVILALSILTAIFRYTVFVDKQGMKNRKNITLLFLFIIFAAGSAFIQAGLGMDHLIVLAIPLSILLSIIFSKITKTVWAETWHLLLFLLVPFSHYLFG